MPESWINPASLTGDALRRWYLRSPADVERERQEAAARRYYEFFYGGPGNDTDSAFGREVRASAQDINPAIAVPPSSSLLPIGLSVPRVVAAPETSRMIGGGTDRPAAGSWSRTTSLFDVAPAIDDPQRAMMSDASAQSGASSSSRVRQLGDAPPSARTQPSPINPYRTPVFQTGPDGKLHPIPGWHTTGPFDFKEWSHNIHWGGVAKDLAKIGFGVASFFGGAALAEGLLPALGPEAEAAVADGIAESPAAKAAKAFNDHHSEPKYMGGAEKQDLVRLEEDLHRKFHNALAKAHREAGFPPVGGKTGSRDAWAEFFRLNPAKREQAMDILRRVSREFDETYGTNISSKLSPASNAGGAGTPPSN